MQSSAPADDSAYLFDLLAAIPDPRRRLTRVVYPLANILFITLAGTVAGMNGWIAIFDFAALHRPWLETFLDLSAGIPPARTIERVVSAIRPEAFEGMLMKVVAMIRGSLCGQVVSIDGKASRSVVDPEAPTDPLFHLHVWAGQQGLLLGMKTIAGAREEAPAARELLSQLEVEGATITGDANLCTKANTEAIRARKAHYQLTLKGNRGPIHEKVKAAMERPRSLSARGVKVSKHVEQTSGHGRKEKRTVWAVKAKDAGVSTEGWTDLVTIAKIKRERITAEGREVKFSYLISSRAPDAEKILRVSRRHWSVENQLHWHLDVHFGEDTSRVRTRVAGQNLATARRLALMLLKQDKSFDASMPRKIRRAAMSTDYLAQILGLKNSRD